MAYGVWFLTEKWRYLTLTLLLCMPAGPQHNCAEVFTMLLLLYCRQQLKRRFGHSAQFGVQIFTGTEFPIKHSPLPRPANRGR